ncbi:MAG: MBL fold metallo-hydrolase [Clostridia bacterium]|nr:MBL fold metallo-hydrolase [Clostridia bacterium]
MNKYIKPSKLIGNLYFAGTYEASTHLIDTGDGLILIDPGYFESLFMVINNIWELGFNPKDIKYILVSHAHSDHMDATDELVKLTGAKTFIGEDDLPLLTGEIYHFPIRPFKPDVLIKDGDIISLGNTKIKCIKTPGHTKGTISFFFDIEEKGNVYKAGMFGGAGCNTLVKKFLDKNCLPYESRNLFLQSVERLLKEKVDVFVGNHVQNNNTDKKIELLEKSDINPFIDSTEWQKFLLERKERIKEIINNNE